MKQIRPFTDSRLVGQCCYCGAPSDTKDHVPSKILLNKPYPENLPVVGCCNKCNQAFSKDELYLACLIECVVHGTTEIDKLSRQSIKDALTKNNKLHNHISGLKEANGETTAFRFDEGRVKNVIMKLAKGHVNFENGERPYDEPVSCIVKPLPLVSQKQSEAFFSGEELAMWPEAGSRAMIRFIQEGHQKFEWVIVEEGQYSYQFHHTASGSVIKIVIQNYLLAEVRW